MLSFSQFLFITTGVLEVLVGGIVFSVFASGRDRSARIWAASCALMAAGMVMLLFRAALPTFVAFGLTHFVMFYSLSLQIDSFRALTDPKARLSRSNVVLSVAYGLGIWALRISDWPFLVAPLSCVAWISMNLQCAVSTPVQADEYNRTSLWAYRVLAVLGASAWAARLYFIAEFDIEFTTDPQIANVISLALIHLALISQQVVYLAVRLSSERSKKIVIEELNRNLEQIHSERNRLARQREEDREQLIRDMHDGFGSHLASLRIMAEENRIEQSQFASYLAELTTDLYLVVDALSLSDIELGAALRELRLRHARLEGDHRPRQNWSILLDGLPRLTNHQVLQILRIVQEALNNSLRHAHSRTISVSASYERASRTLVVGVRDDGTGIDASSPAGRGLNNIRRRARELGADLTIGGGVSGTEIVLRLTLPEADVPAPGAAPAEANAG